MTNRFEYTAPDGRYLRAADRDESGVWVATSEFGCLIPLDRVEEVVAGLRDMARQASGGASGGLCMCGHRKDQHVIVSGRLLCDSCDPDDTTAPTCTGYDELVGTVGGLRVHLGGQDVTEHLVDPAAALAGALVAAEQYHRAREVLSDGAVVTAATLRGCPSKHPALGRICELPEGHGGMHTGAGAHGGAVWERTAGDAE